MEIRTVNNLKTSSDAAVPVPPDRGAYLRRKSSQRLHKKQIASRRLMGILRVAARLAVLAAGITLLASGYWYTTSSGRFQVRQVTCAGCVHVQPAQLDAIIRREFPGNILQIDLQKLHDRLEKERWIKRVEIRRVLPGALVIYVEERTPAVIAELNGGLVLTDCDGILLDKYSDRYGELDAPVFSGLLGDNAAEYADLQEENSSRIALGLQVLRELRSGSPDYTRKISEIDLSDSSNVRILLVDDTAEVFLGDRDFLKRFRIFMANMAQYEELKADNRDIASVDLRFEGKIIYHQRPHPASSVGTVPPKQP
jgi:cell division septal protein FtsQ